MRVRRSWRKLHLGVDAGTRRIVASLLTTRDVDDGSQVGPLLDWVEESFALFTGDDTYEQEGVTTSIGCRHPDAAIIVPPRSTAVPSEAAKTVPTQFIDPCNNASWVIRPTVSVSFLSECHSLFELEI